jgi:acetyltransferase-like isoleucine patch superfamily enzyme
MLIRLLRRIKNRIFYNDQRSKYGYIGAQTNIPRDIKVSNPSNIFLYDNVSIGGNAILYATNAKITIKKYFVAADGLRISTGQHERRIGRFLGSITENEKNKSLNLDNDVIIHEDVWAGFNVTILDGVEIGRGCTIAAQAVCNRDIPPYCIAGGIPARVIKMYWSVEQILEHEQKLYPKELRLSMTYLEQISSSIK